MEDLVPSTFGGRIDQLIARVGPGVLEGRVVVDQVYAHYQHENLLLKHPQGGEPLFLTTPLYEFMDLYMGWVADSVLEENGPKTGMEKAVEHLAGQVAVRAPVMIGNLRESAHPSVTEDDEVVYDRPPLQRRLTEQELTALHHVAIRRH
jgi:hypothetical protein